MKIAVQPDEIIHQNGVRQSFSDRWAEIAPDYGAEVVPVDVFANDVMDQIAACDAFMWRCDPAAHPRLYAKRLLLAVEKGLGIPVFPALNGSWHYEDKVSQSYYLAAAGIPAPRTHIFWMRARAEEFCENAVYPFVVKLATGYRSANVRLVYTKAEALFYVDQLFGTGVRDFGYRPASELRKLLRRLRVASEALKVATRMARLRKPRCSTAIFMHRNFCPITTMMFG